MKVGPTQPGLLTAVNVNRGDAVATGDLLFSQDDTDDKAARDQAARQLDQAEKQLANLQQGAKPTEIQQARPISPMRPPTSRESARTCNGAKRCFRLAMRRSKASINYARIFNRRAPRSMDCRRR